MPPRSVRLAELSWVEVRDLIAAGYDTIVQSYGATEQHGPHLPLGTDAFQGDVIAERVARRIGNALVAPTIAIGWSDEFLDFPGSMSLAPGTVAAIVEDCCRSFATSGFRRALLLVAHAGNCRPMADGIARSGVSQPSITILADPTLAGFIAPFGPVGERLGISPEARNHAGHSETSMMLAIRPDLVLTDRYEQGFAGSREEARARLPVEGVRALAPNGLLGQPDGSSAEAGEAYLDAWAAAAAALTGR
ncbi:MAG: creatininase family protein [Dehalococcoidia bacterium]